MKRNSKPRAHPSRAHPHRHVQGPHGHSHAHPHPSGEAATPHEHKARAPAKVATYVVVSSDTRTEATDASGRLLCRALEAAGHPVAGYEIVKDDPEALRRVLMERAPRAGARAAIVSGGTGIGPRDSSYEVIQGLLEKRLDGFGELFRMLSYEQIGSAAMMSRAVAGTYAGMLLFSIPGSAHAAELAMQRLILPELGHAVRELTRVR